MIFARLYLKVFAACANSPWLVAIQNRDLLAPSAKNAKSGSLNFVATPSTWLRTCFAPLREIFRVSVAALPR
jgi:hypothetical protein